ncbi:Hsp70 family protein [Intestinibacter sp.]
MSIYLGIDFGTSTNYITRWYEDGDSVKPVPNMDPALYTGDEVFPNVIYYQAGGSNIIGKSALKFSSIDPQNGVVGVKRKLLEDNYEYNIPSIGSKYTPIDVSADIFTYIKNKVSENNGGSDIDGVVISVPYAYGNKERIKIKKSAEKAGLKVIDLIEEPVAAAISYGIFNKKTTMGHSEKIMVFDFGGGTLDITIFEYQKSTDESILIEVLNTEGLNDFGGQIIDKILMSKILEKAKINTSEIKDDVQRLKFQSEIIAKTIEMKEECQYWEDDEEGEIEEIIAGIKVSVTISKEEIENWLRGSDILSQVRFSIEDALIDAGDLDIRDIDRILLVGGSSNLCTIKKVIKDIYGKEPEVCNGTEIDKMVGYGAGVYCGMKIKNKNNIKVIQKLSYSIGVRVGTKFDKLIQKNEKYGTFSKRKKYSLLESKQNRDIEVYQGNSADITKCFLIGKIPISHLELDNGQDIEIELGTNEAGMVAYKIYSKGICIMDDMLD